MAEGGAFDSFFSKPDWTPYYPPGAGASGATGATGATGGTNPAGYIDPATAASNPDAAQGVLTRAQWADFLARYKPNEEEVVSFLDKNPQEEIEAAKSRAAAQSAMSQESMQRSMGRTGMQVTPEQAAMMATMHKNQAALNVIGAKDTAKRSVTDRNLQATADMINLGKGISGQAGTNLGGAAGLAAQRQSAYDAAKAQAKQQDAGLAGTAAAMALGLILGF